MKLPVKYDSLKSKKAVRDEYVRLQGGLCAYCGSPLDKAPPANVKAKKIDWKLFPRFFTKHPVHLQHDHKTGLTEGAVHALCNAVLWQYHGR